MVDISKYQRMMGMVPNTSSNVAGENNQVRIITSNADPALVAHYGHRVEEADFTDRLRRAGFIQ